MKMLPLFALFLPTVASAQFEPTHFLESQGFCPQVVEVQSPIGLGSVCLTGNSQTWDWSQQAFPADGFRVLALPGAPPQGANVTPYAFMPFDPAYTAPIPMGAQHLYAVVHCTNTHCTESLYLRVENDTLTWWSAPGLAGASQLVVDVGDELVFTPISSAPIASAPVVVQWPW